MMKDSEGVVSSSLVGLADRARVSETECAACLEKFLNRDADDTSGVEEGRKIRRVQGGWQVVNHEHYRFSTEAKREFWRQAKAEQRRKESRKNRGKGGSKSYPVSHEQKFVKSEKNGDPESVRDAIVEDSLKRVS